MTTSFRPRAWWPWPHTPRRQREATLSPALAELARREVEEGLTAEVAWGYARHLDEILGPLIASRVVRPLSMFGGWLRAVALDDVPDIPGWLEVMRDVEFVQTTSVDVCRALAGQGCDFIADTSSVRLLEELRAQGHPIGRVFKFRGHGDGVSPREDAPFDTPARWGAFTSRKYENLLPLICFSQSSYLVFDRATQTPHLVDGAGQRLPKDHTPAPILPNDASTPSTYACHADARGEGWAAATLFHPRRPARIFSGVEDRWAVLDVGGKDEDRQWLEELYDIWRTTPEAPLEAMRQHTSSFGLATVTAVEMVSNNLARISWMGDTHAFLLRGGRLERLTRPHTYLEDFSEADRASLAPEQAAYFGSLCLRVLGQSLGDGAEHLEIPLAPEDRLVVCTPRVYDRLGDEWIAKVLTSKETRRGVEDAFFTMFRGHVYGAILVLEPGASCA